MIRCYVKDWSIVKSVQDDFVWKEFVLEGTTYYDVDFELTDPLVFNWSEVVKIEVEKVTRRIEPQSI